MTATLRAQLRDAVKAAAAAATPVLNVDVSSSRSGPRELRKPLLMLRQEAIRRPPGTPRSVWMYSPELLLLVPERNPDTVDDVLEPLLERVLDLMDSLPEPFHDSLIWTEAERIVFASAPDIEFHGYRIPLQLATGKEI